MTHLRLTPRAQRRLLSILPFALMGLSASACYKSFSLQEGPDPNLGGQGGAPSGGNGGNSTGGGSGSFKVVADSYTITQGQSLTLAAGSLLANDSGAGLFVTSATDADSSRPSSLDALSFDVGKDGSVSFTPRPAFFGVYRARYSVSSSSGDTGEAEIIIRVRPLTVDLSYVAAGWGGFVVEGAGTEKLGSSLASAGDVDGDGYGDLLAGAPASSGNQGRAVLIYGGASLTKIALGGVTANQRVQFFSGGSGELLGSSVAGNHDFNADGKADLLLGAPGAVSGTGKSYLVYGQGSYSASSLALASFGASDTPPVTNSGSTPYKQLGQKLAIVERLISSSQAGVGALTASSSSLDTVLGFLHPSASASVAGVSGLQTASTANRVYTDLVGVGSLDGSLGGGLFTAWTGTNSAGLTVYTYAGTGSSLSSSYEQIVNASAATAVTIGSAGLFSEDTKADLAWCDGAKNCYVVAGPPTDFTSNAYKLTGFASGAPKVGGGLDVNGDGRDDVCFSDGSAAYVIYGLSGSFPPLTQTVSNLTNNLTNPDGRLGYQISSQSGISLEEVRMIADLNGDGLPEIAVAAPSSNANAGRIYVIYGI